MVRSTLFVALAAALAVCPMSLAQLLSESA